MEYGKQINDHAVIFDTAEEAIQFCSEMNAAGVPWKYSDSPRMAERTGVWVAPIGCDGICTMNPSVGGSYTKVSKQEFIARLFNRWEEPETNPPSYRIVQIVIEDGEGNIVKFNREN